MQYIRVRCSNGVLLRNQCRLHKTSSKIQFHLITHRAQGRLEADGHSQDSSIIKELFAFLFNYQQNLSLSWKGMCLVSQWFIRHELTIPYDTWALFCSGPWIKQKLLPSQSAVIKENMRFSHLKHSFFGKHTNTIQWPLLADMRHCLNICPSAHVTYRGRKRQKGPLPLERRCAALCVCVICH